MIDPMDDLKSSALYLLEQRIKLHNTMESCKEAIKNLEDKRRKIRSLEDEYNG